MNKEKISVEILSDEFGDDYDSFLLSIEGSLLFQSNRYRKLLQSVLPNSKDYYFVARGDNDQIIGVLPTFLLNNDKYGNVINSLPFYGSNGAVIGSEASRLPLLESFNKLREDSKCVSSTIISSPFEDENRNEFYKNHIPHSHIDERVGQLTELPLMNKNVEELLMEKFHYKTRNMVRKGYKSEITFSDTYSDDALKFLIDVHDENMIAIGGKSKPVVFFKNISEFFQQGEDYKIFTAYKDNNPIAALLLFYFNGTVEYFTPVIKQEYRKMQPLSVLILEAMKDACKMGYKWWNWGGTWLSQEGVYRFKKRWGTVDMPYYYYIKLDEKVLKYKKETLANEYPYFYVCPFDKLTNQ